MTKEEAKEIIESECYVFNPLNFDRTTMINTALDVAVEALEQEPCNDAISKASVFEIMGNLMSIPYDFDRPINKDDVSESMDAIRALPPVTPTRKVGKWIGDKAYPICPKCNCNIIAEYISCSDYAEMYTPMNYCPNCGAEMSEE